MILKENPFIEFVQIQLNYLDYESMNTIQKYVDYNFIDNDTKAVVKRLIRNRKEELQ